MGKTEYVGLTIDGDALKVARIRKEKGKWKLTHLDRVALKEDLEAKRKQNRSREVVKEYDGDFHFGIDQHFDGKQESYDSDLKLLLGEEDATAKSTFNSNLMILKKVLEDSASRKVKMGITVQAGDTNFQVFKDKDFRQLKKKELKQYVEVHLKKAYGKSPDPDQYRYQVREDGSLLLISYQEKPYLLKLIDNVRHLYKGKIKILQMLPDESILAGLIRKNYQLDKKEVTCVIHMGYNRSRVFFMQGNQIIHAISPIDEGRDSSSVLSVIFSKILFELETGELPGLDRIIITNNELNSKSVDYFKKQFPNIEVAEFGFNQESVEIPEHLEGVAGFFTSAIGSAWAAGDPKDQDLNSYSMVPQYIHDRQNVMQLRWHGLIILLLLLVTPFAWNVMYQEKEIQIKELNEELFRTELSILDLENVVNKASQIESQIQIGQTKLDLLNNLSDGNEYWSRTLKTLNDGLGNIQHVWVDMVRHVEDGFIVQGYSMDRTRIPQVTNLFKRADLNAVSVVDMRGIRLYKFSIKVYYDFTDDLDKKFSAKLGPSINKQQ